MDKYNVTYDVIKNDTTTKQKKEYWELSKGLQKVDNLKTSKYLDSISQKHINGEYDIKEAINVIEDYHKENNTSEKEADIVCARMVNLLETYKGFTFSPITLKTIHKELFTDILPYKFVGQFRDCNISKKEDILNGDTVIYSDYRELNDILKYDFETEKEYFYNFPFTENEVKHISKFISDIWQVHPFREGNTRTTVMFLQLYLKNMGILINNEPFKNNSDYFRNSLVRSNYSRINKNIKPDFSFLNMFFGNLFLNENNDLNNMNLYIDKEKKE